MLYLDERDSLIDEAVISDGSRYKTSVCVRAIAAHALLARASRVIVAHNHPSGNTTVSAEDKKLTIDLHDALTSASAELFDHLIITGNQVISLRAQGYCWT